MKYLTHLFHFSWPVFISLILLSESLVAADYSAPLITLPVAQPVTENQQNYRISANVEDETGLVSVKLHYRQIGGNEEFLVLPLSPTRGANTYTISIKINTTDGPGIEYFIEARDVANNISEEPPRESPRLVYFPGDSKTNKSSRKKYWWMALGAVALGVLASSSSGSKNSGSNNVTLSISTETP